MQKMKGDSPRRKFAASCVYKQTAETSLEILSHDIYGL